MINRWVKIYVNFVVKASIKMISSKNDPYSKEIVLNARDIVKIEKDEEIQDAIIEKDKTSKKDTNYLLVLILILIVAIVVFSGLLIIFKK